MYLERKRERGWREKRKGEKGGDRERRWEEKEKKKKKKRQRETNSLKPIGPDIGPAATINGTDFHLEVFLLVNCHSC